MIAQEIMKLERRLRDAGFVPVGVVMGPRVYDQLEDEIGQPILARGGLNAINGLPIRKSIDFHWTIEVAPR